MQYDYDLAMIGLGPAGMAVSIMGASMGMRVVGIEKHRIGGECMNVGCIPSKSLLRIAKHRAVFGKLDGVALERVGLPAVGAPFARVRDYVKFINEKKTLGMFDKVELLLGQGGASFVDGHTLEVGGRRLTARRIFVGVGTRPQVPEIPGLREVGVLTNENMFNLEKVPERLAVLGGGAIAVEMAQAFARLGSQVTLVIRGDRLMRRVVSSEAVGVLEARFEKEGIAVWRGVQVLRAEKVEGGVVLHLDDGRRLAVSQVLVALGRRFDLESLALEKAGVAYSPERGIGVDRYLRTSAPSVYAVGDCNGFAQFSHAAMHQGMIALMNTMMPWPMKRDFRRYVVPWTVFTEPQVSHVGPTEEVLQARGLRYEKITVRYEDYGAAIAEGLAEGFLTVYTNPWGKLFAATIVGEGSGEMINEWALAIQKGLRMHDIMLLQHSFPTMGFLSKRVAETWMMKRMDSPMLRKAASGMFRLMNR